MLFIANLLKKFFYMLLGREIYTGNMIFLSHSYINLFFPESHKKNFPSDSYKKNYELCCVFGGNFITGHKPVYSNLKMKQDRLSGKIYKKYVLRLLSCNGNILSKIREKFELSLVTILLLVTY